MKSTKRPARPRRSVRGFDALTSNFNEVRQNTDQYRGTMIQVGPNPFPRRFRVRLKYSETPTVSTAGSVNTAASYTWRLSSLYDPNFSAGGHQPYQFDQLSSLYSYYKVYKCAYAVRISSTTGSHGPAYCGINIRSDLDTNDAVSGKDLDTIRERANTWTQILAAGGSRTDTGNFRGLVDNCTYFCNTRAEFNTDVSIYFGATNANPSRNIYLEAFVVDPTAGTAISTVMSVELVYYAEMWGYLGPNQS